VDADGRVLGRHAGIHHFTVGQRRGLGVSARNPLYVSRIDAPWNRVEVAEIGELAARGAQLERVSWVAGPGTARGSVRARVKIRHRDAGALAEIEPLAGDAARVVFDAPARAVTPGQAAVFYAGDCVLGGGWIAGSFS